uniref:FHA domain-containing protein n=1 Tax=Setaria digitata TaxID=48799 RepID=A0A915PKR1_9BILA
MISREHTTIFVKARRDRYACFIKDHSLNGTYVNDFRVNVSGEAELQQGDVIKFGHVNGAAIKPGCYGPQTSAEFTFVVKNADSHDLTEVFQDCSYSIVYMDQLFQFEEAPTHRLSDRRRPITIMGNTRQDLSLSSQMFVGDGKNLHTASRLPLGNPPMELTSSWQNPTAAGAAAAAAPFYNLQRFPGYYQAAFPQLSPAYLHSLWPQNPWPSQSPTAAQQLQQHQLEQQKQAEAVAATAAYGHLTNSAWMGANAQIATDTSSFIGAASDSRLRAVVSEQASSPRVASNITVQTAATAVAGACSQRSGTSTAAVTDQPTGDIGQNVGTQSTQLLQSLAQHTSTSHSSRTVSSVAGNISVPRSSGTAASRQHHYSVSSRTVDAQRISRLTDCSPAQVIATPSAIDSVKRMECDSSVPSPPKNQQQQQTTSTMFGVVSTGIVGLHRTATTAVSSQPSFSPVTPIHAPTQVQAGAPSPVLSTAAVPVGERRFSNDRISTAVNTCSTLTVSNTVPITIAGMNVVGAVTPTTTGPVASTTLSQMPLSPATPSIIAQEKPMEQLQRENAERNSRLSGLEELTEDLLEDCGPPRRAPTPASSSSELPTAAVQRETPAVEESKPSESSRSQLHQSPKRRGHGHSDSSRSPTQTPVIMEQKVEPKKRRKNNEVAMLLNDLTEVAWHHLARKSNNKITAPTQTRKVYMNDDDDDADNRSCKSDSSGSEKPSKKRQHQKNIMKTKGPSTKNLASPKTRDSDKGSMRKRGRPKKGSFISENVGVGNVRKKTTLKKKKKRSFSSDNVSSGSGSDERGGKEDLKKSKTLPKDQPGTSAAEKIERALDMMRKRQTLPDSNNESSSSSFVSSSSSSPIRRTWGATSQSKAGSNPGNSGVRKKKKLGKTCRQSRSVSKVPRKQPHKGIVTSSTSTRKKGRKKKKRSSSSESEVSVETSSLEWEKIKPVVTPLPAANAQIVFDEWTYHDPDKQCDARSGCKKPQSESVVWVQCDYCCRWYHMECVTDHDVTVSKSDTFDCGCREVNKTI